MTPAETLTAAAEKLRAAAQDVPAGPWWGDDLDEVQSPTGQVARTVGAAAYPKSRCIALMHPGVGATLAELLEAIAQCADLSARFFMAANGYAPTEEDYDREEDHDRTVLAALAVARNLLGGDQ
ncbi:hypothetical protein [Streptomyces sp. NPDC088925]|uniref:hypothetical protein n=1 Tax=Streptomyces sp. NPDC088925 TaxID=3365914 RepID=UPI00380CE0FA